jgi:hypothetical protein
LKILSTKQGSVIEYLPSKPRHFHTPILPKTKCCWRNEHLKGLKILSETSQAQEDKYHIFSLIVQNLDFFTVRWEVKEGLCGKEKKMEVGGRKTETN